MANNQPHVLFISVDQLCWRYISAHGCKHVRTPNIDKLIGQGISFNHSYAAEPVCTPARASWWTGKYSSEHGAVFNSTSVHKDLVDLGQHLNSNGYYARFVGKWHVNGRDVKQSFLVSHTGGPWGEITDQEVTKSAKAILRNHDGVKPLFLHVGYLNPHDCCLVVNDDAIEENLEILEQGIVNPDQLPPLPDTYHYDDVNSATVEYLLKGSGPTAKFDDVKWRYYLYKYARLCEMVDYEIGAVLDELAQSPLIDNTVIVFSSDHGDGVACHKMKGKSSLWDESVHVPFVIATLSDRIPIRKGVRDDHHFVSGVDLFPTICEITGVAEPDGLSGMSVYGAATGRGIPYPREYAYAEACFYSRMIRSSRYKYVMDYKPNPAVCLTPPGHTTHQIYRELLYDMDGQGETLNLSTDTKYEPVLEQHRQMLYRMEAKLTTRDLRKDDKGLKVLHQKLQPYYDALGVH